MTVEIRNLHSGATILTVPYQTLRGADLKGAALWSSDLRGADLRGANLTDSILRCADLQGADLSDAVLFNADLRGADLRNANLSRSILLGARISDADLRDAKLEDATIMPDGLSWATYLFQTLPELLTAGGRTLRQIKDACAWNSHDWTSCPMHVAFGIDSAEDAPAPYFNRVREFVQLFDARLIPPDQLDRLIAGETAG